MLTFPDITCTQLLISNNPSHKNVSVHQMHTRQHSCLSSQQGLPYHCQMERKTSIRKVPLHLRLEAFTAGHTSCILEQYSQYWPALAVYKTCDAWLHAIMLLTIAKALSKKVWLLLVCMHMPVCAHMCVCAKMLAFLSYFTAASTL